MNELIDNLRKELFNRDKKNFQENLLKCLDYLENMKQDIDSDRIAYFNATMKNLSFALQDKDYLLVTDILKFEILPCLKKGVY